MDIPELDELIIRQLNLQDLSRCARVSKKWHRIFIPYLWRDLTDATPAVAKMVLEDYRLEKQHHNSLEAPHGEQQASPSVVSPPRYLAKYGHWIRELPDAEVFFGDFDWVCFSHMEQHPLDPMAPTAGKLMRQLYKQCPNLQIDHLILSLFFIKTEDILKVVTDYLVPRARHLQIGDTSDDPGISPLKTKHLLSYCSSAVEELTLQATISRCEEETEYHQTESRPWTQLKRLNVLDRQSLDANDFWEWLWKRCSAVEELQVEYVGMIRQSLVEGIAAHMPHLNNIHLKHPTREDTEAILSIRQQGWKKVSISLSDFPRFPIHLMVYSTALERLAFDGVHGVTDKDIVQLLTCCPNLRSFSVFHGLRPRSGQSGGIDAQFFIDQDHDSGSLKPWMCETSLRELEIRIQGIPRPDVKKAGFIEDYPGHGREIQQRVYDRLARFTNLETLWLGGYRDYPETYCLEMSLESGLDRISGLKRLKLLGVYFMRTRIGEAEVKWMVEQWPKLSVIYGLSRLKNWEAVKWLQQHHPEILMEELW